jgi:hypothetical protein
VSELAGDTINAANSKCLSADFLVIVDIFSHPELIPNVCCALLSGSFKMWQGFCPS